MFWNKTGGGLNPQVYLDRYEWPSNIPLFSEKFIPAFDGTPIPIPDDAGCWTKSPRSSPHQERMALVVLINRMKPHLKCGWDVLMLLLWMKKYGEALQFHNVLEPQRHWFKDTAMIQDTGTKARWLVHHTAEIDLP